MLLGDVVQAGLVALGIGGLHAFGVLNQAAWCIFSMYSVVVYSNTI